MKKYLKFGLASLILPLFVAIFVFAGTTNLDKLELAGDLDVTGTVTITNQLRPQQQIQHGVGVVASTSVTRGEFFSFYLAGTVDSQIGHLLIATTPVSGQGISVMVAPATINLTSWVGVAANGVSTGSVVNVFTGGTAVVFTTGTVNAGDVLVSSGVVVGYCGADNTPLTGADVGVALANGTAAGGTTLIRIR